MQIACARCHSPLPEWELASAPAAVCTACGARNTVRAFPALLAAPAAPAAPESALQGEAACFDHPARRAVAACHRCGRFVCQLCAVEFGGATWCPGCVAADRGQGKAAHLDRSRILFDSIALAIPLVSLLFWPLTLITGPGAVVFAAMTWRKPLSQVRRSHWRLTLAALIGLAITVGWGWLIVYWWERFRAGLT